MKNTLTLSLASALALTAITGCASPTDSAAKTATDASKTVESAASAAMAHAGKVGTQWDKPGYVTLEEDGRLWVFEKGSEDLAKFLEEGEPAKIVVLPAAGPDRMTLKGTDRGTMMEYALTRPGYKVFMEDGRLWVFEEGSEDLARFQEHGEPAKIVVLPAAGPRGLTLKGTDRDTMMEYALAKPGYNVFLEDGRLWVFLEGSRALKDFHEHGEPAKIVVRPGAGPRGMTLKSVDGAILDAYMAL